MSALHPSLIYCPGWDMRTYEQQARLATIVDPCLRQETSDFFSECFIPARSKYQAERPATAAVNALLTI